VLPARGLRAGAEKTSDPRLSGGYRGTMTSYQIRTAHALLGGVHPRERARHLEGEVVRRRDAGPPVLQFVDAIGTCAFEGLRYRHVDTGRYPKSGAKTITLAVNGWIESVKPAR